MRRILSGIVIVLMTFCFSSVVKGEDVIGPGKTVKIHYTLTVQGEVADTSEGKDPLEYIHGQKMIIPGLENQLEGLKVGDEKVVEVAAADAYGPVNPQLIVEVPKAQLGDQLEPQAGMVLQMTTPDGQNVPGIIAEVMEEAVKVNFNHPLSGQDLQFEVKIVEIQ